MSAPPIARIDATAQELLDCICEQLDLTDAKCPRRRCLVPGAEVAIEDCCGDIGGGQLSINIGRMYPSSRFPVPETGERNCDAPVTIVDFYASVFRCAPVGGREPASCEAQTDAFHTMAADMKAVRTGIDCCLQTEEHRRDRHAFGDHLTYGPAGNCAGSVLLVAVGFLNCKDC